MKTICSLDQITPGRGVAALLPDDTQVAVFRLEDGRIFAIDNRDPFTRANVLARGLVGDRAGIPVVVSPLLKQTFNLETGDCMDAEGKVATYKVSVEDGDIKLA